MSDEFVDSKGPRTAASRVAGIAPIEEEIVENHYSRVHGSGRPDEVVERMPERKFSDNVLAKIDEVVARESKSKPAAVVEETPPAEAPVETAPAEPKTAEPPPAEVKPAPASAPDVLAALTSERDRILEANRRLVAELDAERKKPAPTPHKLLVEASDGYIDDSLSALRKFVAGSLGINDPNDKRVTDEIKDLYTDLTASELQVTPDTAHQAKRDAARARYLLEREKRERTAQQAAPPAATSDDTAAFIGNRLSVKASDGQSLADKFPLLMNLAEHLDGKKPHDLLADVIRRETKTGRIPITPDDDAMIAAAAQIVEHKYTGLRERFATATPTPSTAKPTPQPTQSASKDQRQPPAARTLTSADASVAPATTPAPKTEEQKPKKFKNDKERREWALRRFDR